MSEEELKQNIFMNKNENGYDYVKRINTQYTKNGLYQNVGRTINNLQQENTQLKQQLKDKDEKISKVKNYCEEALKELLVGFKIIPTGNVLINIEKILESNKED